MRLSGKGKSAIQSIEQSKNSVTKSTEIPLLGIGMVENNGTGRMRSKRNSNQNTLTLYSKRHSALKVPYAPFSSFYSVK